MRFSVQWLLSMGPLGRERPIAPRQIAEALTARGLTVDALEPADDDHVLDVDIPANRPDCLGHLGLARELAAAFGAAFAEPEGVPAEGPSAGWGCVRIADPAACWRYTAGLVRGVRVASSPSWVVRRLERCGLRSVNNVVDASNLVLLALGHPIHFFDRSKLTDNGQRTSLLVRKAERDERLTTLDGIERKLEPDMLVIADEHRPVALAGIIGGAETAIDDSTREVVIEAARFDPRSVRATARRLDLHTDASFRFERGVDPGTAAAAQALAAHLLAELAGGDPLPAILDAWPGRGAPATLELRSTELERLLGFRLDPARIASALDSLRLAPEPLTAGTWRIAVPSWRVDLDREADLVEEVARHIGYGEIPSIRPPVPPAGAGRQPPAERLQDLLSHLGFHEAFGYSMIGEGEDAPFVREQAPRAISLSNPIAEPMSKLRRSMLPGLLRALELNLRRGHRDVRLFETGRVFLACDGDPPREPVHAGVVWCGGAEPQHWSRAARPVDLYDLMGIATHVLLSLGWRSEPRRGPIGRAAFHPGLAFCWSEAGAELAWGGLLHPELGERFGLPVFACEMALDALGSRLGGPARYEPIRRLPPLTRDLAIVLGGDRPYAELRDALRAVPAPAPVRIEVVDRYEGPPLDRGESCLTVRFTLEPRERTLTDAEAESYLARLVDAVRGLGLRIRA